MPPSCSVGTAEPWLRAHVPFTTLYDSPGDPGARPRGTSRRARTREGGGAAALRRGRARAQRGAAARAGSDCRARTVGVCMHTLLPRACTLRARTLQRRAGRARAARSQPRTHTSAYLHTARPAGARAARGGGRWRRRSAAGGRGQWRGEHAREHAAHDSAPGGRRDDTKRDEGGLVTERQQHTHMRLMLAVYKVIRTKCFGPCQYLLT